MGSVLDFGKRDRPGPRQGSSFGLVRELVEHDEDDPRAPRSRVGVIRLGEQAMICRVEDVPTVGDLIHADVTGIVQRVRIDRDGRVLISAIPVPAPEA